MHLYFLIILWGSQSGMVAAKPIPQETLPEELQWFQAANAAYFEDRYDRAIDYYEALLQNVKTPNIYYNLGLAYAHQRQWGNAILNLRRAISLAPSDRQSLDALQHITYRAHVPNLRLTFLECLANWTNFNHWLLLTAIVFWGFIFSLTAYLLALRRSLWKLILLIFFSLGLSVGTNGVIQSVYYLNDAIILDDSPAYKIPSLKAQAERILREGQSVNILRPYREFYQIQMSDSEIYYVPREFCREVRIFR